KAGNARGPTVPRACAASRRTGRPPVMEVRPTASPENRERVDREAVARPGRLGTAGSASVAGAPIVGASAGAVARAVTDRVPAGASAGDAVAADGVPAGVDAPGAVVRRTSGGAGTDDRGLPDVA